MRTIVVLTVFSLIFFATARCVDAGVMLRGTPAVSSQCPSAMLANSTPLQEKQQPRFSSLQNESSGLCGVSIVTVQTVAHSAVVDEIGFPSPQLMLLGALDLVDEILPINPVLSGLLKPA